MQHKLELIAAVLAAVDDAERMSYDDKYGDHRGCIAVLEALTPDGVTDSLVAAIGNPVTYAALTRLVPPARLKTMLRNFQRWIDTDPPYARAEIGHKVDDTEPRAAALLHLLHQHRVIASRPLKLNHDVFQVIDFPDAPDVLSRGQMRQAVMQVQVVQYRLYGQSEQRLGRVLSTNSYEQVELHCDATGAILHLPYQAVVFDGALPAQDLVKAALLAHVSEYEPLTIIPLTGFDKEGEPEVRVMRDGSFDLVFNLMPPSWDEDGNFDEFEFKLAAKLDHRIERTDREVFRITDTRPDSLYTIRYEIEKYHSFGSSRNHSDWVDDDV
jgi:hypothetical protein